MSSNKLIKPYKPTKRSYRIVNDQTAYNKYNIEYNYGFFCMWFKVSDYTKNFVSDILFDSEKHAEIYIKDKLDEYDENIKLYEKKLKEYKIYMKKHSVKRKVPPFKFL